jgi:ABC-2 type transport system ATP-binding protein
MQEIEAVCNRVIIINKGEIVADYPDVKQIANFAGNDYHIEVEFLNPVENLPLKSIKSAETLDKKLYRISAVKDIRQEIFDFAVANNKKILMMRMQERKMEEVFRELTTPNF